MEPPRMILKITMPGDPATKKNSSNVVRAKNGRTYLLPSDRFRQYQDLAGYYIKQTDRQKLDKRLNVKCLYYMRTKRRVDLVNLLEATCDILTHYGVIADDNTRIVAGHDGSRVMYDKENPRAEIEISELEE